jgi:hypothetical protein
VNSAGWEYWAIEMNELSTSVLKVMESSSLGRMSIYVLSKQCTDLRLDINNLGPDDVSKLTNQLRNVLPFFLGDETETVVTQIRKLTGSNTAVMT